MAPRTTHQESILPLPAELVIQICKNLDQADLQRCRLACKRFSYAAEISLFREVHLRRNVESFMRLRSIAYHPRISLLVEAIRYSGKMFAGAHLCKNINDWSTHFIGLGFEYRHRDAIRGFSQSLPPEELEAHYQRFCAHHHSEQLMRKYDTETQDLTNVIAKLPQLDEVCFAYDERHILPSNDPFSFDQLSSVARETLVELESHGGFEFHARQFTALLKAAHTVQRPLHTIKALGVPWDVFQQSNEVSDMMISAAKACQSIIIKLLFNDCQKNGRANLSKLISSSPYLQTLEISFSSYDFSSVSSWIINLSEILEARAYWPNLKRLKLVTMKVTDIGLMNLLTIHAASLRSLELADIFLEGYQLDGKECHGSWVGIILFLQCSLSLTTVRLGGYLSNQLDEAWDIYESDQWDWSLQRRPEVIRCLKHRVERFVVEGGTCPLPVPYEVIGDWSWAFCSEIL